MQIWLHGNLDATEGETPLIDVKLKDFTIKPIEGGSAQISFKAQLQADLRKIGETMIEEWTRQAGAEGAAVLAIYRK